MFGSIGFVSAGRFGRALGIALFLASGIPVLAGGDPCTGEDLDGDGVLESCEVCPGFDDNIDTDGDGIPDGCDPCPNSSQIGDSDGDGDRDWDDYARLAGCLAGPGGGLGDGCECFDANENGAVDLRDARQFLNGFSTGPGCNIDGRFVAPGERYAFPFNCRVCRPALDPNGWSLVDEGTICNTGSGDMCDPPEFCEGDSGQCPDDVVASTKTLCNPGSGDECDPDEYCTGVFGEPCPDDQIAPQGIVCRPGSGDMCDPPERCTGVADDACPDDVVAPQGVICLQGAGDVCDPNERCTGIAGEPCPEDRVAEEGTVCNEGSGDICDPDEVCSGVAGEACPEDRLRDASFVCRPSQGECDIEELCTGVADDPCPSDAKRGVRFICRRAEGPCDHEEICNGVANVCPPNLLKGEDVVCRAAGVTIKDDGTLIVDGDGLCDVPEYCTGMSVNCPPDRLRPRDVVCRDLQGPCDNIREFCTVSSGKHCTSDESTSTRLCRVAAGVCDVSEYCEGGITGSYPDCPPDDFAEAGVLCRDLGPSDSPNFQVCDVQEFCDGGGPDCPVNEFLPFGTVCERSDGAAGECQDVGSPSARPKCVEAGTVLDGDLCTADFECASGNCSEMIDRSMRCIPAEFVGFGGTCDGNDFVEEGNPQERWCYGEDSNTLWCCKGSRAALTGETGTCKECCLSDGGSDEQLQDVDCENAVTHGPRTFCCSGRCTDTENDPYNCGECGVNCYDDESACREFVECQPSNPDGLPEPGQCIYQSPCQGGGSEACWDSCVSCLLGATCGDDCESEVTCFDIGIDLADGLCDPCFADSDCGEGQFCLSSCGTSEGLSGGTPNIICLDGGYCVEQTGDCVEP